MDKLVDRLHGLIHSLRDSEGKRLNINKIARLVEMTPSTLHGKFRRGSLKAEELNNICNAIGYKVEFLKDDKK